MGAERAGSWRLHQTRGRQPWLSSSGMHGTLLPCNFVTFNESETTSSLEEGICWGLPSLSLTRWWEGSPLTWKHLSVVSNLARQEPMSPWEKCNSADIQCVCIHYMVQHSLISCDICKYSLFCLFLFPWCILRAVPWPIKSIVHFLLSSWLK